MRGRDMKTKPRAVKHDGCGKCRSWAKLCLAAQADNFQHRCLPGGPPMVDDHCPMCDIEHEANLTATEVARLAKRGKGTK